jgi:hypothetical protein
LLLATDQGVKVIDTACEVFNPAVQVPNMKSRYTIWKWRVWPEAKEPAAAMPMGGPASPPQAFVLVPTDPTPSATLPP